MDEQELQILECSLNMYFKFGIKSVTMDDVAKELGISKKTIYKYFENKAALVQRVSEHIISRIRGMMETVIQEYDNAIEQLFAMDCAASESMKNQHPALKFQLKKYYPKTHDYAVNEQRNLILHITKINLQKGIATGLYRKDLNLEIIAFLYFSTLLSLSDQETFVNSSHTIEEFSRENLIYHIRGIASSKGLAYLEQKLSTQ
ncbi:MAG: TetR/AcrR family transcriptional regulator [Schleiferiaceae bacterium]|nr:TetR/AcrR family transcriptional regulator [Schleiferiaceae bacterium]